MKVPSEQLAGVIQLLQSIDPNDVDISVVAVATARLQDIVTAVRRLESRDQVNLSRWVGKGNFLHDTHGR